MHKVRYTVEKLLRLFKVLQYVKRFRGQNGKKKDGFFENCHWKWRQC